MPSLPPFTHRILIVGDAILDEYLIGRATRLSREAAVPVLERTRRELILGGAANPAVGIVALGGSATFVSVVGTDDPAITLRTLLAEKSITAYLVEDESRPTTLKTRLLAEGGFVSAQHLARIDHLSRDPLATTLAQKLLAHLSECAADHRVVLVSDYKNGVITPEVVEGLYALRDQHDLALVVDSQGDLDRFRRFDLIKCNRAEAEAFLGQSLANADDHPAALAAIRERCEANAVVVTLGSEGIAWVNDEGFGSYQAPRAEVYDVTGAGDTVIAVLALCHAAGLPLGEGCRLASLAASLTVRVMGNYAPMREELEAML